MQRSLWIPASHSRSSVPWELILALSHPTPGKEVDLVLVGQKQRDHRVNHGEGETIFRSLMLSTFIPSEPSEPAKSISLTKCPMFSTSALFSWNWLLLCTLAIFAAVFEIIVGAIVGAVVVAVVVLTLTGGHGTEPENKQDGTETTQNGSQLSLVLFFFSPSSWVGALVLCFCTLESGARWRIGLAHWRLHPVVTGRRFWATFLSELGGTSGPQQTTVCLDRDRGTSGPR